jgi:hypothetical protein
LPSALTTPAGQTQIFLQKINSTYANETDYVIITSSAGSDSFSDLSESKVVASLCNLLTLTPVECGLQNLLIANNNNSLSPTENATNSSKINTTE